MKIDRLARSVWKPVRWLIGAIIVGFISIILASAFSGINTWKLLKAVVFNVTAFLIKPHSIIFVLLLVAFSWILVLHRKVGRLSRRDINKGWKEKELELGAEHILILKELANEKESVLEKDIMDLYFSYYPDSELKDYRFMINDLTKHKLMRHSATGRQGRQYTIESKGLDALRQTISKSQRAGK